ncbi:MAG TPA: hypothetical protein VGM54_19720 [Chthoniobacter sp.]|jgi:cytosine/adenosine deaminase-related metal-dependent hydrolase
MKLNEVLDYLPQEFLEAIASPSYFVGVEDDELDSNVEKLKIALTFPMLDEARRELLLALWHARMGYCLALGTVGGEMNEQGRTLQERQTIELEQLWMEMKSAVKAAMAGVPLTDEQRAFLQEEMLTLTMKAPED